jgi:hypothetical protein
MKSCEKDINKALKIFKQTGDIEALFKMYRPFLLKYKRLMLYGTIDYRHYDIRYLISTFLKEKDDQRAIKKGKYHSAELKRKAENIVQYLRQSFYHCSENDVEHELKCILFVMANRYKEKGYSFEAYLYKSFKFHVRRFLKEQVKSSNNDLMIFYDQYHSGISWLDSVEDKIDKEFHIDLDPDLIFNNPKWISGEAAGEPFDLLSRQERLILAKYYYEGYQDNEISQLIGIHPKSITRIRKKIKIRFERLIQEGEIKWIIL